VALENLCGPHSIGLFVVANLTSYIHLKHFNFDFVGFGFHNKSLLVIWHLVVPSLLWLKERLNLMRRERMKCVVHEANIVSLHQTIKS
jgi:hypothetical protein